MKNKFVNYDFLGEDIRFYREKRIGSRRKFKEEVDRLGYDLSVSTLIRVETGESTSLKKIEEIAKILGFKFEINEEPYEFASKLSKELVHIDKSTNIFSTFTEMMRQVKEYKEKYKDYIYLNELFYLYHAILSYALYGKAEINNDILELFKAYYFLLNENDSYLALCLIYFASLNESNNSSSFDFKGKFNDDVRLFENVYKSNQRNGLEMYLFYKGKLDKSGNNKIHQFACLLGLGLSEIILNSYDLAIEHLNEALTYDTGDELPAYLVLEAHKLLAIAHYKKGEFEKSIEIFLSIVDYNYELINMYYLIFFDALEKTDNQKLMIKIIKRSGNGVRHHKIVKDIFNYYKLKLQNPIDYETLENHLLEKLFELKDKSIIIADFLFEEIMTLIKETKHFRLLFLFFDN